MLQPLCIPKRTRPRGHSRRAVRGECATCSSPSAGNALIDPLPLDEAAHGPDRAARRRRARRRHDAGAPERGGNDRRAYYGADVVAAPAHREAALRGRRRDPARASAQGARVRDTSPSRGSSCAAATRSLGSPAGASSMPPDDEYADAQSAALGLRAILRENPGGCCSSLRAADLRRRVRCAVPAALCARRRRVHRINVDELDVRDERDEHAEQPGLYNFATRRWASRSARAGWAIASARSDRASAFARCTPTRGRRSYFSCSMASRACAPWQERSAAARATSSPCRSARAGRISSSTRAMRPRPSAPWRAPKKSRRATIRIRTSCSLDTDAPLVDGLRSLMVAASPQLDYFHGEEPPSRP